MKKMMIFDEIFSRFPLDLQCLARFTSSLAKDRGDEYPVGRGKLEPVGVMICAVVMGMASMEALQK